MKKKKRSKWRKLIGWENRMGVMSKKKRKEVQCLGVKYAGHFRLLTIMLILGLFFHFGAVTLTHAMVVKEKPKGVPVVFVEANLGYAEREGLEPASVEKAKAVISQINREAIVLSVIVLYFLLVRNCSASPVFVSNLLMGVLTCFVVYFFMLFMVDFFNNFGYLVGVILRGGF